MTGAVSTALPILSQIQDAGLIDKLLTGGGLALLASVFGGLFLWNRNASEGAKAIAEGSRELVETIRGELEVMQRKVAAEQKITRCVRDELAATHRDLMSAHEELRQARVQIRRHDASREKERVRFREWVVAQKAANDEHLEWDKELIDQLSLHGIDVPPAPPFGVCPPEYEDDL